MPSTRRVEKVESYEYIEKTEEIKINEMSKTTFKLFYTHVICEIVLRAVCAIYIADEHQLINTVVLNGYRGYLDRSRGKHIRDCIITVQISRDEYEDLYIKEADGEAVIRRLCTNVPKDFTVEPLSVKPIYNSGNLNVFYIKQDGKP